MESSSGSSGSWCATTSELGAVRGEGKTALVTGGAGFLGSHLVDHLVGRGYAVMVLDNLITGDTANLAAAKGGGKIEYVRHDVSQPFFTEKRMDLVFHMASPASPKDYLDWPIPTLKVGALGTHNMLGLALKHRARFLLASTSEVYGDPKVHPQTEDYWGNVNPIGPRGVYDEAKRFAEAMTMAYHTAHGLDTRIVRIFNTYGPRMRLDDGRVVPNFMGQALRGDPLTVYGDGSQTRSFCYVSDLIDGLYRLMMSDHVQPVNVGNPEEMRIIDFAHLIIKATGSKSKVVFKGLPVDDPKERRPDITKAKRILGWEPKVPLSEGIKVTMEYFRERIGTK